MTIVRDLKSLDGGVAVILASTGGHLAEALRWEERLRFDPDSVFVTFDTPQSNALVGDRRHVYVPYIAPRQGGRVVTTARRLLAEFADTRFDVVFSTGAALALAGVPLAYRRHKPFVYMESVCRFTAPSMTGRLLEPIPGVSLFSQHDSYIGGRWSHAPSLFTDYACLETMSAADRPLNVFVTVGTIQPYRFDRLVDTLLPLLRDGDSVTWQLGDTIRTDVPGRASVNLDPVDFDRNVETADVVVSHGGVGTLLRILEMGKQPVVMSRLARHREHVDDHQTQVQASLESLGLIKVLADSSDRTLLLAAAGAAVCRADRPATIVIPEQRVASELVR